MTGPAISRADKKALALYVRITLSYGYCKHAHRATHRMLAEHEALIKEPGDDLVLRALYSSSVTAYARPFNSSGKSRYGRIAALTTELHAALDSDDIEMHDYMLHCRNKLIAHTDASAADPEIYVAPDLPGTFVVPVRNDALAPFGPELSARAFVLTEKAYRWAVLERRRLEPGILHLLERKNLIRDQEGARDDA